MRGMAEERKFKRRRGGRIYVYRYIYIYIYVRPSLALCKVEDDQQLQYKNRRQLGWIGGQLMQSASGITTTLVPTI